MTDLWSDPPIPPEGRLEPNFSYPLKNSPAADQFDAMTSKG